METDPAATYLDGVAVDHGCMAREAPARDVLSLGAATVSITRVRWPTLIDDMWPQVIVRHLGDGVECSACRCSVDAVELVVGDAFDDLSESGPRIEWRSAVNHTVNHTMKRPIHAGATS